MKRFVPSALCTLLLSLVLSACPPSKGGGNTDDTHGAVTVSFDKNNSDAGSTEANPDNMTILPPITTLGSLPKEPTRPGYAFAGWNMQSDGNGEAFTEETPIQKKIHFVVYAKWKPVLNAQLSTGALTFSPIEEKLSFKLTVSGFKNKADANSVGMDTNFEELTWLLLGPEPSEVSESSKTFVLKVSYHGKNFTEAPTTLHLTLKNIPAGYEYAGGTQSLHIVPTNGKDKTRPIPVHKDNIERFNDYARTQGLALHYQLMENATLPAEKLNNWTAIGTEAAPFTGSFDGGGHSIFGLNINSYSGHQGLFGYIRGEAAVIKNLGLEDGSVRGSYYVGGVVGYNNEGTVQNCYVTNSGSGSGHSVGGVVGYNSGQVHNSHATGSLSGSFSVGGVVGYNTGEVHNSHATGSVRGNATEVGGVVGTNRGTVHNSSYATGSVSGNSYVGGLVGDNSGEVHNSHATGNVSGDDNRVGGLVGDNNGKVHNCYATGNVSGNSSVGGLVGYNIIGEVQNCYATGSVISGSGYVGGVVGVNIMSTVQNCVALNPSVTRTSTDNTIGRVVGQNYSGAPLTNNHARNNMQLIENGSITTRSSEDSDSKEGADVSAEKYGHSPFWKDLCSEDEETGEKICWDFENVWKWEEGLLPILRGVGGEQSPTVQPLSL